ncbi:maleylpyruvate isomerase family mycothiol-dependent enzyme [Streptacidiphilus cavernicola]|uniref:Maleylpyruvate isomerase family mycothiol-dependent enzyme n=1 Tax=Streptacidiphilus cavernicola TaxID=3342716 RepID=A0ABV6W638_9ACTN
MIAPPPGTAVDARLLDEIAAVAAEIALVLHRCDRPDLRIPGALWSVGEAAAHLALANELMADLAAGRERRYGDGTPGSLAAANEESLAAYPERDPTVLAEAVVRHTRAFAEAAASRPAAEPLLSPLGPMDLGTLACYLLTHMLGHGYDLARATGQRHMVTGERVELALPFLTAAMPRILDSRAAAGHRAGYAIGLRGGPRFGVVFADGAVTVTADPPPRPDCTIVCEPVGFFLMALGRRGPWSALARGAVLAYGRRPWLAPRFTGYFTAP